MPKTTSDLDDFSQSGKNQIRFSRQRRWVESKTVPKRVRQPANRHFRLRTLAQNLAHIVAAPAF